MDMEGRNLGGNRRHIGLRGISGDKKDQRTEKAQKKQCSLDTNKSAVNKEG